ncbi:MAG: FliA/WhiG family RNA polymerase sigma factor [Acidobacteriaceae bacterium]|nr:FliA/WhiG family RNA polymerase sigma factor [Acidobacteriaceae bacterium]
MNAAATKRAFSRSVESEDYGRRDQLISEHLSLVSGIASHIQKSVPVHIELDDLIHAGTMGLFDAATKYREDREVTFATYAKHRIRGAILDYLRQTDWASRDLRKRQKQLETVTRDLKVKLNRDPSEAELAEAMGLSPRQWKSLQVDLRSLAKGVTSLDMADNSDQPHLEPPGPEAQGPDRLFARAELRDHLNSLMNTLPARQRQVISLYYIGDYTMREIGGMLGVNESRISQIHRSALERMQVALEQSGIRSAAAY